MRMHHLGIVGRSLDVLRRRFIEEGGLALTEPIEDPIQRVVVQFYRVPESSELWELVAPLGEPADSPIGSRIARGGGLDHVCYELDREDGSLEDLRAAEVARGAQVICEPVVAAAFGRRIMFVYRRSARILEFVEPRPMGSPL